MYDGICSLGTLLDCTPMELAMPAFLVILAFAALIMAVWRR